MFPEDATEPRTQSADPIPVTAGAPAGGTRRDDDPLERAEAWLDDQLEKNRVPPLLIVIGLGSGHLLDVLDRRAPDTRVLAVEPDLAPVWTGHSARVLSRWQRDGRLVRLTGPDFAGADEAWRLFPPSPDDFKLLVDPSVAGQRSEKAVHAAQVVKRIVFGARANADARRKFAPRYLTNVIRNAPAMVVGSNIQALQDVYRGTPAIIAAAGPSLDDALAPLHETRDSSLLIACDTALRPLIANGLPPQLVVAVDPGERNARHFQAVGDCRETCLVAESALDPSVGERFHGRTFWFRVAEHHPWPWYRDLGIDVGVVEVWGSVLTAAFQVATLAGCDPIILVGADFCWTGGRPYARGTTYEMDWSYSTAIGNDLQDVWKRSSSQTIETKDLHGRSTVTTPVLQAFRDWMLARATQSGRRVINASGAGNYAGKGVDQLCVTHVPHQRNSIPSPKTFTQMPTATASAPTLAARFRAVQREVDAQPTAPLAEWIEFSGDGYRAVDVAAALEASARKLDHLASSPGQETMPWEQLIHRYATPAILNQLPESLARLHGVLNGAGVPTPRTPPERATDSTTLLADALELLGPICGALTTFVEDPEAPLLRWAPTTASVSGQCAWPADIAWPIQLFEAMLGAASEAPWLSPDSPFFAGDVVPRNSDAVVECAAPRVRATGKPASALLALEWMICGTTRDAWPAEVSRQRVSALLHGLRAATQAPEGSREESASLEFTLDAGSNGPAQSIRTRVASEWLARALTGMVRTTVNGKTGLDTLPARTAAPRTVRARVVEVGTPRLSASVSVSFSEPSDATCPDPLLLTPRVLTDEGVHRSILGYTRQHNAVFASLHGRSSFVVHEDGAVAPHLSWPDDICGELPLGTSGVVAWNNGTAHWPAREPGCVMYRRSNDDEPVRVELPFWPTVGTWWRDRMYWTSFPAGIGSWAPGEDATVSLSAHTLLAIHPGEHGLVLAPCETNEAGGYQRRRCTTGWRWTPGMAPVPVSLGPDGAASSHAVSGGWTASAHPEADVVRLVSDHGLSLSMTCYYPFTVAWAGRSLVVSTVGGELLMFECLREVLEHWLPVATSESRPVGQ